MLKNKGLLGCLILLFFGVIYGDSIVFSQEKADINVKKIEKHRILINKKNGPRKFISCNVIETKKINIEENVFRPTFCKFDNDMNLYILDYSTMKIHKYHFSGDSCEHISFGKGIGQGPGELGNPTDLCISGERIYIVNPPTAAIEVYSTNGNYIKRISFNNGKIPSRIVVIKDKLIVRPQEIGSGSPFYSYDLKTGTLQPFGELIHKRNLQSSIFHDGNFTKIDDNRFCFISYVHGLVQYFEGTAKLFVQKTIDGERDVKLIEKEMMKGIFAVKLKENYYTSLGCTSSNNILINKVYDADNKVAYYDIYEKMNFKYLGSIKNIPKCTYFSLWGNKFVCIDNFNIIVTELSCNNLEL